MRPNIFRYSVHLIISIIILLIIFFGCHKSSPGVTQVEEGKSGSLSLGIDKQNAPPDVVEVRSLLVRENYEDISGTLNLLSDSSAEIFFEEIYVGKWHLLVEALNENETVIYKGETDVNILEGITTQINLVLYPTGSGTGNIYIYITWGADHGWIDFPGNPLFTKEDSPSDPLYITQSKVLHENGIYKMWFTNLFKSALANIGYAESKNGFLWDNVSDSSVLFPGEYGSWDDYTVSAGPVIKIGSEYRMYYSGFRNQDSTWLIGLATSLNGKNWTKSGNPVLSATPNEYKIVASDMLIVENIYYMFYSTINYPFYEINLALSADGINWNRYENNPILEPTEDWEGPGIYYPTVIYEENQFIMVYMNSEASGFGMAYSYDGKTWKKKSDNPFFRANNSFGSLSKRIAYPYLRNFGTEHRIYYTGYDNNMTGFISVIRKFQ